MLVRKSRSKKLTGGLTLMLVTVLLSFTLIERATADAQMATSVVGAAGGEALSTNFKMKSTLGQSTPIGPSASINFQVSAGFWYQDPVAPAAIGDMTVTLSIDDIVLQWSHAGDNVAIDHYVVYRNTDPGFEPAGGDSISGTKGTSYQDSDAAGTVGTNYFYVIKAVDPSGNKAEDSNRVGEFDVDVESGP
jgi:hypothetical protein